MPSWARPRPKSWARMSKSQQRAWYNKHHSRKALHRGEDALWARLCKRNPHRKSRGRIRGSASGVMLGHLVEMVVVTKSGDKKAGPGSLKGLYLSWLPKKRNFAIVRKTKGRRGTPASITAKDRDVYRRFHQNDVVRVEQFESPDPVGATRELGRLRSLTYVTPRHIPSLQKRHSRWVHEFGDHGESGHGAHDGRIKGYPTKLMPMLCRDSAGNFFIKRKPGNKYDVTEWIYW